eukprot:TRINITY_DN75897_c0_g1_i1.p1 TRINITY_DN75897_c0_g1~~TRINITY_DN75897_c0_g1_i1.p1  ORF type:complete len:775 (+),score=177.16 TRINITY_DN75897_c0_g1_i1:56-2380(+)
MESVCLGKCMPAGPLRRKGYGVEADAEIARLQEELRDLQDRNSEIRSQVEEHEARGYKDTTKDVIDPSQVQLQGRSSIASEEADATNLLHDEEDEHEDALPHSRSVANLHSSVSIRNLVASGISESVAKASILGKSKPVQVIVYTVAFLFVVFVLISSSTSLGAVSVALRGEEKHEEGEAGHRRLGGGVSPLLQNIAFCLTGCGLTAFIVGVLKQPLMLGYILGGVLVGPNNGLDLVHGAESVREISNLGLVFLLFMVGLELNVQELTKMGRVVIVTGLLQFPICAGVQFLILLGLQAAGLHLGDGPYAASYLGIVCSASSTVIVAKHLLDSGDVDRPNGRLSMGILICQSIWAFVFLALQPHLTESDALVHIRTLGMTIVLIIISLFYAKFVMPAVLFYASRSVELMLVLSLAWCFFLCCIAHLSFIGIGMEEAAVIAGVALATFPYSADFNNKIKYIRDFFITLFFAALGMQIPPPSLGPFLTAILLAILVLVMRAVTIFGLVYVLGGGDRLGTLATINLSQVSELALVLASLGQALGHINNDTLTILIWTFMILSVTSHNLMKYNHSIYRTLARRANKAFSSMKSSDSLDEYDDDDDREIVLLSFHRIASMLVAEFQDNNPEVLEKLQVIDVNQSIKEGLEKRGVKFTCGDFSCADVLEQACPSEPKIVLCTTPDSMLQGITNMEVLQVTKIVWPGAIVMMTADNPKQASDLYNAGADYVLRSAKLCAERLYSLIRSHAKAKHQSSELKAKLDQFKSKDKDRRKSFVMAKI